MSQIDIPLKRLMQIRLEDWVEYLIPNCIINCITELDTSKVPSKKESRLDKLILINSLEETFILNIEPQGYLEHKLPARMLRYRSDIWEYTIEKNLGTPSIKQAVIFFYEKHDNKKYSLSDNWNDEETLKFSFKAIKVWEIDKNSVINKNLIGLYPLLPLMKKEKEETNDDIIVNTISIIKAVQNDALQADLLAVMSILAEEKFTRELIRKYIRRDMLMKSLLFSEWIEEERQEAVEKTAKESTKKHIIDLLSEKFIFVPKDIREGITYLDDLVILEDIHRRIIKIDSLEEFQQLLDKARSMN